MKYAVIKTGGKQYKVHVGDVLEVERLNGFSQKSEIVFDSVLLVAGDGSLQIGTPTVSGASVTGTLQDEVRGPKIHVMKYKSKVRHRRVTGHRQKLSQVLIKAIEIGKKEETKPEKKAETTAKKASRKKSE